MRIRRANLGSAHPNQGPPRGFPEQLIGRCHRRFQRDRSRWITQLPQGLCHLQKYFGALVGFEDFGQVVHRLPVSQPPQCPCRGGPDRHGIAAQGSQEGSRGLAIARYSKHCGRGRTGVGIGARSVQLVDQRPHAYPVPQFRQRALGLPGHLIRIAANRLQ